MAVSGWSSDQYDGARNALAYLNARYFEEPDGGAASKAILDAALTEGEKPIEEALADLFIGMAHVATFLTQFLVKDIEAAPADTFARVGRLIAPPDVGSP